MGLEIRTTPAQIGISQQPGRLNISTQNAKLELQQKHAKINIHTEQLKVKIDQYEAFASAGLKNYIDLTKEIADRAKQNVMDNIASDVADGHTLGEIERGGNAIAAIAKKNAYTQHEFGLDYIPKTGPKFEVEGNVEIEPENINLGVNNGVEGEYTPAQTDIEFEPARVDVNLKQYGSIEINYIGNEIDTKI